MQDAYKEAYELAKLVKHSDIKNTIHKLTSNISTADKAYILCDLCITIANENNAEKVPSALLEVLTNLEDENKANRIIKMIIMGLIDGCIKK